MNKEEAFMWACTLLREQVNAENYGAVIVSMEKGRAVSVRCEINNLPPKAPLDLDNKAV